MPSLLTCSSRTPALLVLLGAICGVSAKGSETPEPISGQPEGQRRLGLGAVVINVSPVANATKQSITLQQALDFVAQKDNSGQEIEIILHDGEYAISKPLQLNHSSSARLLVRAAEGARPVIRGLSSHLQWQPLDEGRLLMQAQAPDNVTVVRSLFVHHHRITRSKMNASMWMRLKHKTDNGYLVDIASESRDNITEPSSLEMVFTAPNSPWTESRCSVESTDSESNSSEMYIRFVQPCFSNAVYRNNPSHQGIGLPIEVENVMHATEGPNAGHFFHSRKHNTITFKATSVEEYRAMLQGEEEWQTRAPQLQHLVVGEQVRNVVVEGVVFQDTSFDQPSTKEGFVDMQAGVTLTGLNAHEDSVIDDDRWSVMPAAVSFHKPTDVHFSNCKFRHLGAAGLAFGPGAQRCSVTGSYFTDISGNGIQVGGIQDATESDPTAQTFGNVVNNNHIHSVATEFSGCVAVWFGYSRNSTVGGNYIHHLSYTGISMGWGWEHHPNWTSSLYSGDNRVTNNFIADFMQGLKDGAAVYLLGRQSHSEVRGNFISAAEETSRITHLLKHGPEYQFDSIKFDGIYLDEGSNQCTIHNNVVVGLPVWLLANHAHNISAHSNFIFAPTEMGSRRDVGNSNWVNVTEVFHLQQSGLEEWPEQARKIRLEAGNSWLRELLRVSDTHQLIQSVKQVISGMPAPSLAQLSAQARMEGQPDLSGQAQDTADFGAAELLREELTDGVRLIEKRNQQLAGAMLQKFSNEMVMRTT